MADRVIRWAGVAAIVFVVLVLISAFSAGEPPDTDDAVSRIREYFVDNRSAILWSNLCGLIATPLVVWFAVVFRELVRGGDRTTNALGTAFLAAVLVTAPMAMVGGALSVAAVYVDGVADTIGDDALRIIFTAQSLAFSATSAGLILVGLAAALAVRRSGALPVYVMWLGFLMVVGNLLGVISVIDAGSAALGFAGLLTFALFLLATGITMAAGRATPVAATA